ncbi:MAG: hypothetical protein FWC89_09705 [Defluviitaleaceae bacterium]|nr:hypothetical protein [Defluviitaleaceae bacterium]
MSFYKNPKIIILCILAVIVLARVTAYPLAYLRAGVLFGNSRTVITSNTARRYYGRAIVIVRGENVEDVEFIELQRRLGGFLWVSGVYDTRCPNIGLISTTWMDIENITWFGLNRVNIVTYFHSFIHGTNAIAPIYFSPAQITQLTADLPYQFSECVSLDVWQNENEFTLHFEACMCGIPISFSSRKVYLLLLENGFIEPLDIDFEFLECLGGVGCCANLQHQ